MIAVAGLHRAFIPSKISGTVMKRLLRFCLPLIPSTIFWWITGVSDRYMVAHFRSDVENGLYAAAYKIPTLLTYVVTIFNDAWRLSAVAESEDRDTCTKFYSGVFKYYVAVMFTGGAILAVGAQVFASILFADSYFEAWRFIPILSAATVFTALDTFLGSAYFTVRKTGMSFWTSFAGAALNVVMNLLLIPTWGAMGASVATLASYFVVFVIRAATMYRFIPFKMYPVRVVINTVLLAAIVTLMTILGNAKEGIIASAAVLAVCIVFNGKDILFGCLDVLKSLKGRKKRS